VAWRTAPFFIPSQQCLAQKESAPTEEGFSMEKKYILGSDRDRLGTAGDEDTFTFEQGVTETGNRLYVGNLTMNSSDDSSATENSDLAFWGDLSYPAGDGESDVITANIGPDSSMYLDGILV
jgi:hypothetical protein